MRNDNLDKWTPWEIWTPKWVFQIPFGCPLDTQNALCINTWCILCACCCMFWTYPPIIYEILNNCLVVFQLWKPKRGTYKWARKIKYGLFWREWSSDYRYDHNTIDNCPPASDYRYKSIIASQLAWASTVYVRRCIIWYPLKSTHTLGKIMENFWKN